MKPQPATKQIQNTKFVSNFIILTIFKNIYQSIQPETCFEKL